MRSAGQKQIDGHKLKLDKFSCTGLVHDLSVFGQ